MKVLILLFSKLPVGVLTVLAKTLSFLLNHVIRYRSKVIQKNLQNAFPDKEKEQIDLIKKEFYKNFSQFLVETLKLFTLPTHSSQHYIRLDPKSLEEVNQKAKEGKSIVVLSGHNFNWELCSLLPPKLKLKSLLAYKPLKNPFWNDLIVDIRQKNGATVFEYQWMYMNALRYQNKGINTICWMGMDQRPRRRRDAIEAKFLNQDTLFYKDTERVCRKIADYVYFQRIRKKGKFNYEVEYNLLSKEPASEPEGAILNAYITSLELLIHEDPANWLWSHKRWK